MDGLLLRSAWRVVPRADRHGTELARDISQTHGCKDRDWRTCLRSSRPRSVLHATRSTGCPVGFFYRPACSFGPAWAVAPSVAMYDGGGSICDATSFKCKSVLGGGIGVSSW